MTSETIEVPDDAQLTQYGEGLTGAAGFRNRANAETGETEVSLILGWVDAQAAAMLVTRAPSAFAMVRHATARDLRARGFVVRHTPSRTNHLHVSVSAPVRDREPVEWDDALALLFDQCLNDPSHRRAP
jgi:hypothetical protein